MKALARRACSLAAGAALFAAVPAMASVVIEFADAGQTQATAQVTAGDSTSLTDIFGRLRSSSDVDLYLINIVNGGAFSASTVNGIGDPFLDTQLFLLTASGAPVYTNDDADGSTLRSTLPSGSSFGPVAAGLYILGISLSGNDPVNAVNQLLFDFGLTTDVRGANPSLQPASLGGFTEGAFDDRGSYRIQLTGAVAAIPEPTSALLATLGLGLCGATGLRRRRQTL
jgi:hypothetical protein